MLNMEAPIIMNEERFFRRPGMAASLYAGALGDAWGYQVEFKKIDEINFLFDGPPKDPGADSRVILVSDDTQMTMFTIEGALRGMAIGKPLLENIVRETWRAYLDWFETQSSTGVNHYGELADQVEMRARRAPGNTCMEALDNGRPGMPFRPINNSKGCGGVMRIAPFGFLLKTPVVSMQAASYAAALTHGHPDGWGPAGILANALNRIRSGETISESFKNAINDMKLWVDDNRVPPRILKEPGYELYYKAIEMAGNGFPSPEKIATLGAGWTGDEALAIGIYCAMSCHNIEDVIKAAIYHDGDSDSTGSIAAQIFAARHGLDVPASWINKIDVKKQLDDLIAQAEAGVLDRIV